MNKQPEIISACPAPVFPNDKEFEALTQIPADSAFWSYNDRIVKQQDILLKYQFKSKEPAK